MAPDEIIVEPVFGQAEGQLVQERNTGVHREFLPFLFALVPKDVHHVRLSVSDFHSQTWQSDFSASELEEFRDRVGIAGSVQDFLAYLRTALSSKNVRLILGGLDDAAAAAGAGNGGVTGTVVAQKTRGTPLISLPLTKLEGQAANDAKGEIALGNFQAFVALSSALASERALVSGLKTTLAAEKAKTEKLQEQINAANGTFKSRSKLHRSRSSLSAGVPSSQQSGLPSSQLDTQAVLPSLPATTTVSGAANVGKEEAVVPKASGNNRRVPVAPASRRAKRRGTVIRDGTDE